MTNKTMNQCLPKRIELLERVTTSREIAEPTAKELDEAYGYLDYCLNCGKKFWIGEANTHTSGGNFHEFGCSFFMRLLGIFYTLLKIIFVLIIAIPMLIYYGIKWCVGKMRRKK